MRKTTQQNKDGGRGGGFFGSVGKRKAAARCIENGKLAGDSNAIKSSGIKRDGRKTNCTQA